MKIIPLVACALPLLVLGCKHQPSSAPVQPQPSLTVSNGGYTWFLGSTTVNGTNVPASAISLRPLTNGVTR